MSEDKYKVQLENFEGPLDLLLHLIDKDKIDIYDIPIATITDQYLGYLDQAKEMDLNIASEFLLIAATLISIKTKMLLPKKKVEEDEAEVDPREELVERLLEYKFYKEAAKVLKDNEQQAGTYILKNIDVAELMKDFKQPNPVENVSLDQLLSAFEKVMLHIKEEKPTMTLEKEEYDVEEMMASVIDRLENNRGVVFHDLFSSKDSKRKIVTMFLAILELCKLNKIHFKQRENFGNLWVFASV